MSAPGVAPGEVVPNRGIITVAIMLATIMQILDTTIANVALPSMQGSLNAAQDTITWVLTSYIVSAAIATPLTGWVSDKIGRKRLFMICIGGFTLASMLCGIATSLEEMVVFRIAQGFFGAGLVPLSQAVLLDINPRERHGQAMAIWGAGLMVGPIAGPTLGGWLTDSFNWRWAFYVNVPVGIVALLGVLIFMPETKLRERRFDLIGFALLSLGVGALQMMLDRGEQLDWFSSTEILAETGLMVAAFWMFAVHIATAKEPFIEVALLRDRNFVVSLIFIFTIGIILLATMALLPPMLQNILGYPVITSGLVLAPRGVGTMISMIIVGRLVQKVDARLLILGGLLLTAYSLWEMTTFSPEMGPRLIVTNGVVQGLGLGFLFVPLSTLAFATLRPELRTEGSSLFSLVRNLGSSVGISIMATLLAQNIQVNHAELAAHVSPFNPALDSFVLPNGQSVASGSTAALAYLNKLATAQAQMISYLDDFKLMALVALVCIPMLLLLRGRRNVAPAGPPAAAATAE
jgi:MFS transporter, DHA2 family, multidrug resistance protein